MTDLTWMQEFVDARIKLSQQPTGIPPGVHSGITFDRFGRAVSAQEGGGIRAIYKLSTGFSVTHTTKIVNFDQMLYDPLGLVTPGTAWAFVANDPGFYQVQCNLSLETQAGWSTGFNTNAIMEAVFDDTSGSVVATGPLRLDNQYPRDGDNNIQVFLHGAAFGYLGVGDTLYVNATQGSNAGTLVAAAARSHIFIVRV